MLMLEINELTVGACGMAGGTWLTRVRIELITECILAGNWQVEADAVTADDVDNKDDE